MYAKKKLVCFLFLFLAGPTIAPAVLLAQTESFTDSAADTSSPRATLKSFIDSCNEFYALIRDAEYVDRENDQHLPVIMRILDCIDSSELPSYARQERAAEVAVCIKEILDRVKLPPENEIPDTEVPTYRIPGTRITIARIEEGPQKHEYLFSAGTVDRAVDYLQSIEFKPYRAEGDGPSTSPGYYNWYMSAPGHPWIARAIRNLPDRYRFGRSYGMTNWKWPGLIVSVIIAVALMILIYRLHFALILRTRGKRIILYCLTIVFPIAALMVPFLFEYFAHDFLTIRGNALYVVSFGTNAIAILAAVVVVFAVCNRLSETVIASPHVNPQGLNAQFVRIVSTLMSVALSVVVMLVGGQYLGIPIATLLASAGIGGVAIALGAQDTLKTLFGTLMLMGDKPFRVGERIVFKGYDGVVEDIGLRSTRLRLLTSHQVTIPNDELARTDIENVGRRKFIRRVADIHIPLDTPHEKIEQAVEIVRNILDNHEGMNEDYPPRVFFLDFLPTAFTIRAMYWYHPANYWDYLAFGEKFNFAVSQAFEEQGIGFSLPQRITHTSLDSEPAALDVRVEKQS